MPLAIAYQDEAGVVGNLAEFVEIEGQQIRALQALEARLELGREYRQRSQGAIDVEPEPFLLRQRGERVEIVDRPDIDRAGIADEKERRISGTPVGGNRLGKRVNTNTVAGIHRDKAQCVAAETAHLHRQTDAAMGRGRDIGGETLAPGRQPYASAFKAQRRRARNDQRDEIGDRGSGDEDAGCAIGKTEDLPRPLRDLALDLDGCVVAAATIWVERRREHLGEHSRGIAAALHPAHESGMNIAARIRQDALRKNAIGFGKIARTRGSPARKPALTSSGIGRQTGCSRRCAR